MVPLENDSGNHQLRVDTLVLPVVSISLALLDRWCADSLGMNPLQRNCSQWDLFLRAIAVSPKKSLSTQNSASVRTFKAQMPW